MAVADMTGARHRTRPAFRARPLNHARLRRAELSFGATVTFAAETWPRRTGGRRAYSAASPEEASGSEGAPTAAGSGGETGGITSMSTSSSFLRLTTIVEP